MYRRASSCHRGDPWLATMFIKGWVTTPIVADDDMGGTDCPGRWGESVGVCGREKKEEGRHKVSDGRRVGGAVRGRSGWGIASHRRG